MLYLKDTEKYKILFFKMVYGHAWIVFMVLLLSFSYFNVILMALTFTFFAF